MANRNPYPWDSVRMSLGDTPAPTSPTMADMTKTERAACQWMQCDVEDREGRAVIIVPNVSGRRAMTLNRRGHVAYEDHAMVVPRPDLPRLEWPEDPDY